MSFALLHEQNDVMQQFDDVHNNNAMTAVTTTTGDYSDSITLDIRGVMFVG